jgi:hypothetical protein
MPLTVSPSPRALSFNFPFYNLAVVLAVCALLIWHVSCDISFLAADEICITFQNRAQKGRTAMKPRFQSALFFTTVLFGAIISLTGCATAGIDRNKGAEAGEYET